jgi:cobalt/nickel transport system permease protein
MLYIFTRAPDLPEIGAMHIPDGFLNGPVVGIGYALTAIFLAIAIRQTNKTMGDKTAPLMGVLAAFIFAGQMINFPVAGGTSGHLLGGTLAAILLGPWAAMIVMASVISVQALVFQDGGLAALGTNIFNMGILTVLVGYPIYLLSGAVFKNPNLRLAGVFAAAWISVIVAATLTSFELAISDTSALDVALPAMLGVHVFIGIGEGLITAAAIAFVLEARPDLVEDRVPAMTAGVS